MLLIWNLQGLRDLLNLIITSFLKKSAWCEKKVRWDSKMAEYSTCHRAWKCFLKMHLTFISQAQMVLMCTMVLFFCSTDSLEIVVHSKTYLESKHCLKKFYMVLKLKIHLQKSKNIRKFNISPSLKMFLKCIGLKL